MKAIRVQETGDPDVLHLEDVPVPKAGPGQVRVRVHAAGVNFIDVYYRTGAYARELPFTLGVEAAGVVDTVGPDVTGFTEGDRVAFAPQLGAYAEQAVVPATALVHVPDGIDTSVAAAVMLQGMTAHYLTHSAVRLDGTTTVLVHAAAGGVGHLLTQIAKRLGACVLATVSTAEKDDLARQAGADEVIRYRDVDFAKEVDRLTNGVGVDVVYDSVGKDTFDRSLDCLRPRGYLVLYGQSSGPVAPMDPQILAAKGSVFLTRPTLGHYVADPQELSWRATDLFLWIAAGKLEVRIDQTWPLANAAESHRYIEARKSRGKILLFP
jgi:NADPH2:quinone reductase